MHETCEIMDIVLEVHAEFYLKNVMGSSSVGRVSVVWVLFVYDSVKLVGCGEGLGFCVVTNRE